MYVLINVLVHTDLFFDVLDTRLDGNLCTCSFPCVRSLPAEPVGGGATLTCAGGWRAPHVVEGVA